MVESPLQIQLFGRLQIKIEDHWVTGFDTGKVTELFVYLLMYRDRTHFRETLADTLWGDCASGQSKKYLRQALWQLQTALSNTGYPPLSQFIVSEAEWIKLHLNPAMWLDVAEFEVVFSATRGVVGQHLTAEQAYALQSSVEIYKGDLLEGCYQDWILFERERFQIYYLTMLEKLMDYCETTHAYETGLDYGTRILRLDRAHESTHYRLMRLHYLRGDRTSAIRQYHECQNVLHQELGVQPAQETEKLYQHIVGNASSILAQPVARPVDMNPVPVKTVSDYPVSWETVLLDIEHVQQMLALLQKQIRINLGATNGV